MPMWVGETIISVALIILSMFFLIYSNDFPKAINPADVGPAAFPRLLSSLVILFALTQIVLSLRKKITDKININEPLLVILGIALSFLYPILISSFGYFYVTPFFLIILILLLGNKNWIHILGVGIGFTLFIYLVFYRFLQVSLPV
ncbi:Protein of unknown function DUF1468 [Moorella glycerini]|uniref:Tripartite tricarboxylate transporter TctB family protein n=1 Tax=Neomoorella stamsii TaxID=1266720 RepID=A0A9X7J5K3_9FIRM|nr:MULTISPECIES: tripartite tricarboxylate transporter TctB family protein [Moorella]PRR76429.1 Tripartite tricarboxylate transporter TctB family protein [Moorella stamsii]CEP67002.1 Protein of unknown function DUF1468 [Moorella glycerini]